MNVVKHMEAIFLVALSLACVVAFAATPPASTANGFERSAQVPSLIITAKHMTAKEKAGYDLRG